MHLSMKNLQLETLKQTITLTLQNVAHQLIHEEHANDDIANNKKNSIAETNNNNNYNDVADANNSNNNNNGADTNYNIAVSFTEHDTNNGDETNSNNTVSEELHINNQDHVNANTNNREITDRH